MELKQQLISVKKRKTEEFMSSKFNVSEKFEDKLSEINPKFNIKSKKFATKKYNLLLKWILEISNQYNKK